MFLLIILSHGGENGIIGSDQGEDYTTYEVWDALSANDVLKNSLKCNVFGVRNYIKLWFIRLLMLISKLIKFMCSKLFETGFESQDFIKFI